MNEGASSFVVQSSKVQEFKVGTSEADVEPLNP